MKEIEKLINEIASKKQGHFYSMIEEKNEWSYDEFEDFIKRFGFYVYNPNNNCNGIILDEYANKICEYDACEDYDSGQIEDLIDWLIPLAGLLKDIDIESRGEVIKEYNNKVRQYFI